MIEIRRVKTKKEMDDFIFMPWKIYKDDKNWVPPLIADRKKFLNPKKNPFFNHAEVVYFIAYKDEEPAGTIAAMIDFTYNDFHEENIGSFGFFEAINDNEVINGLFEAAENYLREKKVDEIRGPYNFSTNHTCGLLIDGFDSPPVVEMTYNPEYYVKYLDDRGFGKYMDLLAYYIKAGEIPEGLINAVEKVKKRAKITVRTISLLHFFRDDKILKDIYNDAWSRNCCFVPMDEKEYTFVSNRDLLSADPRLALIGEVDGQPVGFAVGLPDINEILINAKGKLFPSAGIKILGQKLGMVKLDTVRIYTLGIKKDFQDVGLGAALYFELWKKAIKLGYKGGEASWILENNEPMNNAIITLGGKVYKTYRLYTKKL